MWVADERKASLVPSHHVVPRVWMQSCFTPLHMAVDLGHTDVTRQLLNRGADVNAQNDVRWAITWLQGGWHVTSADIMRARWVVCTTER